MTNKTKPSSKRTRNAFRMAEAMSHDLALKSRRPSTGTDSGILGLLPNKMIREQIRELRRLDVDAYIQRVVLPSENQKRLSTQEVIQKLGGKLISEDSDGPLYTAELEFLMSGRLRRIGVLAQNHKVQNGIWYPHHHRRAAEKIRFFASHSMPLVTFMDTPGAAADSDANLQNQAHSISFLIAEMANLQLPVVGVVFGCGYSGGAIPLATANVLLSIREGVFNTIHPRGLSNIARKYNLSWQESAKYIGVSSYELWDQGYFDGIVDFSLSDSNRVLPLKTAILSAIEHVEENARDFLKENPFFFEHYRDSIQHYLNPSELLIENNRKTDRTPTGTLNIFGVVYRYTRYLRLRQRITSRSVHQYSRLSHRKTPSGMLLERQAREREEKFTRWLEAPLELRYHDGLNKRFQQYQNAQDNRSKERGRFAAFFMGDPRENYDKALDDLVFDALFYLYNFWKGSIHENLLNLNQHLGTLAVLETLPEQPDLLTLLRLPEVRARFEENFPNLLLFDLLYNQVIDGLPSIAGELKGSNRISEESVAKLFDEALERALAQLEQSELPVDREQTRKRFFDWLSAFISQKTCDEVMGTISAWKRVVFPRMSPPLFGLVRYYFSGLLPSLHTAQQGSGKFDGKITPKNIGIKDFWNRLDQAYKDLLIQNLLRSCKRKTIAPNDIIDRFFAGFQEFYADRITANPLQFPGFREAIERALGQGVVPCGVVTGLAQFTPDSQAEGRATEKAATSFRVGLVVSNGAFQAGAFDMASCEKVCRLLDECARLKLPVIFFISSAGMQTKEGAGALFSMAIINDRITRFVKELDLPVVCFGYRDCTGGAQASFVTHPLVRTYYLSGAQIPFAGQLVVESHLPAHSTLANYLSRTPETMDGLVINPFDEALDEHLREIDPDLPVPQNTVSEVMGRVLSGEYQLQVGVEAEGGSLSQEQLNTDPIRRVLIHARGCTATRLIRASQSAGMEVVLVASDPDIESYPASLIRKQDRLVCIGGSTPQDSYLNAMSVIRIAEQEEADAIHPGIGFLSESARYARICREHGFNFIGPRAHSMDLMGNKSNAIATARSLKIPVVPGSEGALVDPVHAAGVAEEIGFPVLIKATHGGGGKGIHIVDAPEEFQAIFSRMSQEALSAFGNGDLYLEKFIGSMRHLEVQVIRDLQGNSKLLHIRDCSVQRSYQKLIEESAFALPQEIRHEVFDHSLRLIDEMDYVGAGTVEFIYDLKDRCVYFMEMNTRLQVEHPVSEMVTGVDLVKQQFGIASGESIAQLKPRNDGHAIEVRINAERAEITDSGELRFVPAPGEVTDFDFPEESHVRVIPAVQPNSVVSPHYDSLIAQVIVWGKSRKEAVSRLSDYLGRVRIHGVPTNLELQRMILDDAGFRRGRFDTAFLKGFFARIEVEELIRRTQEATGKAADSMDRSAIELEGGNELKVLSPQMGGFYRSVSPEEEMLVAEGSVVDVNQPLCLLESMKVFSELKLRSFRSAAGEGLYPETSHYRITRILAEDKQTVSAGDLLFVVQPVETR